MDFIGPAEARCAGAGRTNCSVGVSEEFIKRFEAERQHRDDMAFAVLGGILLIILAAVVGAAGSWVFRLKRQ